MKAGGCIQVGPNPQPRADLTGGGVRIGHDSAAEVLQDVTGPPGPLCTVRAAELLRAGCGPPGPLREPSELGGCQDTRRGRGAAAALLWPSVGRLKPGGCQGTGRAAEVLRAACGPPGPLLGPSELGAVLASIANGCPFAKYPGPLPGCCFLFLGFEVWQKYALRVTLLRGAIHGERKKRPEQLQMLTFLL